MATKTTIISYAKCGAAFYVCSCVIVYLCIVFNAAFLYSATELEPPLIASGMRHLENADFAAYKVNPPLVKMVAAVPSVCLGLDASDSGLFDAQGSRTEYDHGISFVQKNEKILRLGLFCSRIFVALASACCFVIVIVQLFRDRAWYCAPLFACAFLFDPTVLGLSSLVQTDVPLSIVILTATLTFSNWLAEPKWSKAIAVGIWMGISLTIKFTGLIVVAVFATSCLVKLVAYGREDYRRRLAFGACLMFATSIYLVNLCYLFDGFGIGLGKYRFVSSALSGNAGGQIGNRFEGGILGNVPIPLPEQFLLGIDLQKRDFEFYPNDSYLSGIWKQNSGWKSYYWHGFLVKIPHLTQAVVFFGIVCFLACTVCKLTQSYRGFRRASKFVDDHAVLFVVSLAIFVTVSLNDRFSLHFRYVLPSLTLLYFLGVSAIAFVIRGFRLRCVILVIVTCAAFGNALKYPDYLCYFNPLSGGASEGWRHMLGSSYDWGQDGWRIKSFLQDRSIDAHDVSFVGHGYPYWESVYPDIRSSYDGIFQYEVVSANTLARPEKPWLKRFDAGVGIRICHTAWLFPIKDEAPRPTATQVPSPPALLPVSDDNP